MKLIKLEVYVFDHENYGVDEYKTQIENMRHMMATVKHSETVEIGDFGDSHELNQSNTPVQRFRSYFATQPQAPQGAVTGCEKLIERLQACVDEPMWADHAEVSKATLKAVIAALRVIQAPNVAVPCSDISYPDTLEKVLARLAAGSWDSTLIKEAENHLQTLAASAGLAEEYMDWIDCYHAGGDYTGFIAKRFPAAPETPEGKK